MIGSLEVVPFARPCRSFRRYSSCPLLQQKSRRLVCVRAAADNPAVPFPRINATELQGQARAQDAQKFGSGPFENPRGSFINDKESPKTSAKGKRNQNHDSSLSPDDPLPLPMTFPGSKPAPKEQIEALKLCDVEKEDCKEVVYQWTGECKACRGTGSVSFYRKRHEVISTCISCLGIGYVNKITARPDIEDMDGRKENERRSKYSQ
ncbi:protein disulfide-isomerase [Marchantia polymorpha subsp. ruderalis]|uniref:Uncharacterized protein n=1 Tax=Marchantia polymorpha TaxID=3197 RepID=A0A2R6W1I5_MARPO|nr:hypothetical protein MARPO_0186s0009 [Marchantia polymorpha]BBN18687.1 hypothetical protein Mp_8g04580 [Marchantia polymorpha subsp. ruderalis]|eukprot:PTQ27710.1 hypothetical protein MARPO_0186s0009 [Marchantia polymorpha]